MCLVVESAKLGNNDGREIFGTLEPTCYADIRAHVDDDACVSADAACSLIRRAGRSAITAYISILDIGGVSSQNSQRRVSVIPAAVYLSCGCIQNSPRCSRPFVVVASQACKIIGRFRETIILQLCDGTIDGMIQVIDILEIVVLC